MSAQRDRIPLGALLNYLVALATFFGLFLAYKQVRLGEDQVALAKEQMRAKKKDLIIFGATRDFDLPPGKPRLYHFHLISTGEVDIDRSDFELGPYLKFSNPVVSRSKLITTTPPELRVECKNDDKTYVQLKVLVGFRPEDFVSFEVVCNGDPGPIEYTYRIKGGASKTMEVPVGFQAEPALSHPLLEVPSEAGPADVR